MARSRLTPLGAVVRRRPRRRGRYRGHGRRCCTPGTAGAGAPTASSTGSSPPTSKDWDGASAPAQVGKRVVEGLFQRPIPPERAALTNNVVHWAYGLAWGAAYGLAAGSAAVPKVGYGLAFGPVVWTSGYVVLPVARLYQPIWKYDLKTLGKDLSRPCRVRDGHRGGVPDPQPALAFRFPNPHSA